LFDFVPFRTNQHKKKSGLQRRLLKSMALKQQNNQTMSPKTCLSKKILKDKQVLLLFSPKTKR